MVLGSDFFTTLDNITDKAGHDLAVNGVLLDSGLGDHSRQSVGNTDVAVVLPTLHIDAAVSRLWHVAKEAVKETITWAEDHPSEAITTVLTFAGTAILAARCPRLALAEELRPAPVRVRAPYRPVEEEPQILFMAARVTGKPGSDTVTSGSDHSATVRLSALAQQVLKIIQERGEPSRASLVKAIGTVSKGTSIKGALGELTTAGLITRRVVGIEAYFKDASATVKETTPSGGTVASNRARDVEIYRSLPIAQGIIKVLSLSPNEELNAPTIARRLAESGFKTSSDRVAAHANRLVKFEILTSKSIASTGRYPTVVYKLKLGTEPTQE
jgi:hypothetical protein